MFIILAFVLGFGLCLMLLGRSEATYAARILELEDENKELQVKFLDRCFNSKQQRLFDEEK